MTKTMTVIVHEKNGQRHTIYNVIGLHMSGSQIRIWIDDAMDPVAFDQVAELEVEL
jgi:hypothetical protein